jgi:hypothetical protein
LNSLGSGSGSTTPKFNPVEFDGIRIQAGLNSFTLTPKQWIEKTGAVGITSQAGRYGGTYEKWADEEDARLTQLFRSGKTVQQIAETLQRQPSAIRSHLKKLDLISSS